MTTPRNDQSLNILDQFHRWIQFCSHSNGRTIFGIKRRGIFLRIFWSMSWVAASYPPTLTTTQNLKWIFDSNFPGNWFKIGIIGHYFSSSTIWAIEFEVSFPGVENTQNPRIHPKYAKWLPLVYATVDRIVSLKSRPISKAIMKSNENEPCVYTDWRTELF